MLNTLLSANMQTMNTPHLDSHHWSLAKSTNITKVFVSVKFACIQVTHINTTTTCSSAHTYIIYDTHTLIVMTVLFNKSIS